MLKEQRRTSVQTANDHKVAAFLDAHVSFGVVYVSMGSIGNLTPDQIVEMYNGLLECGFPFIWSLRQGQTEHLPSSSTIQVQKFDFLIIPWTNQQEILSHRATRVFITHCGWNSSIEALSCGVPVVTWPLFAEQV